MQVYIGTSGWTYDHWKGSFYPEDFPKRKWLEYYTEHFNTVELNATFYRSMQPNTFEGWYKKTPKGFVWSVKASRFITHIKRLKDASASIDVFLASTLPLKEKLGPILLQLPPGLGFEKNVFESFCKSLPSNYKYTIEARNKSWHTEEALSSLKRHHIAWCISDTAGRYPYREAVTANFVYIRLHGSRSLYASEYTEAELAKWAKKIRTWCKETFVYFDNDYMAYAPKNAVQLIQLLKCKV